MDEEVSTGKEGGSVAVRWRPCQLIFSPYSAIVGTDDDDVVKSQTLRPLVRRRPVSAFHIFFFLPVHSIC